jgi:hypothetical protein
MFSHILIIIICSNTPNNCFQTNPNIKTVMLITRGNDRATNIKSKNQQEIEKVELFRSGFRVANVERLGIFHYDAKSKCIGTTIEENEKWKGAVLQWFMYTHNIYVWVCVISSDLEMLSSGFSCLGRKFFFFPHGFSSACTIELECSRNNNNNNNNSINVSISSSRHQTLSYVSYGVEAFARPQTTSTTTTTTTTTPVRHDARRTYYSGACTRAHP